MSPKSTDAMTHRLGVAPAHTEDESMYRQQERTESAIGCSLRPNHA